MARQLPDPSQHNPALIKQLLNCTGASGIASTQAVQTLWSGYGQIVRFKLDYSHSSQSAVIPTVIVKSICPPTAPSHPRGWDTDASMIRKLESYRVEANWYRHYAESCRSVCALPLLYGSRSTENQSWFIFEDLDRWFPKRYDKLSVEACKPCLAWLARFHAQHFESSGCGLWPTGTYWHLRTRQEEFHAMADGELKDAAGRLNSRLENCQFKTLVHGDAKVANICFPEKQGNVAMVDFQYVGRGCGIRDIAYFLGSCLNEYDCEKHAAGLLDVYFDELKKYLPPAAQNPVEKEWRSLYPIAWADFHRFLAGWMPGHSKINGYTQNLTRVALLQL